MEFSLPVRTSKNPTCPVPKPQAIECISFGLYSKHEAA